MIYRNFSFVILSVLLLGLGSCGIYSFTGSTITAETITIHFIENKAEIVVPSLSQTFTESMRDKFLSETALSVVSEKGELEVSGFINQYQTSYLAVQGDEPAKTRLEMWVKLKYENHTDEDKNLERTFKAFTDFDADEELTSIEDQLIEDLIDQILTDFFNVTVNDW